MADFIQIMKDWRRMCMYYRTNDNFDCSDCPMVSNRLCEFEISDIQDEEFEAAQQTITTWLAEHPEPVYPTWAEWLNSTGLTKHDTGQFCVRTPNQYSYEVKGVDILNEAAYKPIPADIAEKLGIEPKEGT